MTTTTTTRKGFCVRCLHCGEPDTTRVDVDDLAKLICTACDAETTLAELEDHLACWAQVAAWIKASPDYETA
jgi:hypothetical protein